jgi:hypothetical protein
MGRQGGQSRMSSQQPAASALRHSLRYSALALAASFSSAGSKTRCRKFVVGRTDLRSSNTMKESARWAVGARHTGANEGRKANDNGRRRRP